MCVLHALPGYFKASWYQLNYDVVGDTATTADSFLTPGRSFAIQPSSRSLDKDSRCVFDMLM